jgi:PAS domain S-box-containing protein
MNIDNEQNLANGDILVVDDDTANLKFLVDLLTESGYRVWPASDGELALRSVQAQLPELILLDYNMPGMNGIEVCRHLKRDPETRDIPVIFLSDLEETDLKVKALEAGAIDYITKPIELPELLVRIENHLKLYRLRQRLEHQSKKLIKEIEERKRAEEDLLRSERRFRTMFTEAPLGIALTDSLTAGIYEVNPRFAEIAGRTREELSTIDWISITHPEDVQEDLDNMALLNAGEISRFSLQKRYIRPDGSFVWIHMTIAPMKSEEKSHPRHLCMIEDITEQKKMEEQLLLNEKLATIAGLAAGVAHEINTPLSAILQAHQLVEMGLSPKEMRSKEKAAKCNVDLEAVQEYFKKNELDYFMDGIRESALKAANIIKSLLEFCRPNEGCFSTANLEDIMESSLLLSQADYDMKKKYGISNVQIIKEYAPDLPSVICVPVEIEQVILNLLKNSVQAMAEADLAGKPCITLRTATTGNKAVIEVEDNGPGIPEDIKSNIFDPFFTTRDVGIGVGMGLSVSHAIIVDKHKGEIRVESEPGQGAKFIVELPLNQAG